MLVDLSANENIALILEYHYHYSIKDATNYADKLLEKCGYKDIADKRPFGLSKIEKFIIQFIRAYVSPKKKIAIIKPFSMLEKVEDLSTLIKIADILDEKDIQIIDTTIHKYYEESKCLTIK